jgi:hypothetical protein
LVDEEARLPLVPDDPECTTHEELTYDDDGRLINERTLTPIPGTIELPESERPRPIIGPPILPRLSRPCSLSALDGSWYVELTPEEEEPDRPVQIHGAMRIESKNRRRLRVSADIYTERYRCEGGGAYRPIPQSPVRIDRNWYPQFPQGQYSYYVASRGAYYHSGRLQFKVERSLWDHSSDDFTRSDRGWFEFTCRTWLFTSPIVGSRTLQITGEAMLGGVPYRVKAHKTSPYYRGCIVEVDVMTDRQWTPTATRAGGGSVSFNGVYRDAGLEFLAVLDEVDVPADANLSITELQNLLTTHRDLTSLSPHDWRLWLVIGSRLGTGGTLGIMFDSTAPFREGAVSFADPRLPNRSDIAAAARNQRLGDVPEAILRTSIHEIGHAFNLFHPKHDVHSVSTGTTIMNQTGDVLGFATSTDPYPGNATFAFNDHNRSSLIHSPDPAVKPGWTDFGYEHGGGGSAPQGPSDAVPDAAPTPVEGLELDVRLPETVVAGDLLVADVTLRNVGDDSQLVTAALNTTEDYLTVGVTPPGGERTAVRNVVLACTDRRTVELDPGESLTGHVQLTYTNRGYAFDRPGRYQVDVSLDVGEGVVRSGPATVVVRSAATAEESAMSNLVFDSSVGECFALGDVPVASTASERLERLADDHPGTDAGIAAALVLANTYSREVRDFRGDGLGRAADEGERDRFLDRALDGGDATRVSRIATALLMPGDSTSPIVDGLLDRFDDGPFDDDDVDRAETMFDDFAVVADAA